jgi:hypothetical protein
MTSPHYRLLYSESQTKKAYLIRPKYAPELQVPHPVLEPLRDDLNRKEKISHLFRKDKEKIPSTARPGGAIKKGP